MSYGDEVTVVDFSQTPFLCLSGENGHGKSALLDAITWSLWGVSRAGRKNHDDLIRIGADEMSVQFTFAMDGPLYRVLRKRSKRTGSGHWELQQQVEEDVWRSLTGAGAYETERAILALLRMSYDTFLNSAYLRQGQADLFVQQTPTKRKEILAEILDLSRYDELEVSARTIARDAEMDSRDLQQEVSLIDSELAREPEYHAALLTAEGKLEAAQASLNDLRSQADQILKEQAEIAEKLRQRKSVLERFESTTRELERLNAEAAEHERNVEKSAAVLRDREDLEARAKVRSELRNELSASEEAVAHLQRLRLEHAGLERTWQSKKTNVEMELNRLVSASDQRVREIARLGVLVEESVSIKERLLGLLAVKSENDRLERDLTSLKDREKDLISGIGRIKAGITDWESRISALGRQEANCSVCNAPLTPERIKQVESEYGRSLEVLRVEQRAVALEGRSVREKIKTIEQRLQALIKELAVLETSQSRLAQIERETGVLESLRTAQLQQGQEIQRHKLSLQDGSFAGDESDRLKALLEGIREIEPAEKRRVEITGELTAYDKLDRELADLAVAVQSAEREEELRLRVIGAAAEKDLEVKSLSSQLAGIEDVSSDAARLTGSLQILHRQESEQRHTLQSASGDVGRFQGQIAQCLSRKSERVGKQLALTESSRRSEVHNQLALAFGKKGVQALIIENAIPELQDEANRLLEKLSDGDLSVSLETQRASKSKKDSSIETLDIKVSDSLGTRPLEMYSGGEGFRVAFALRLALSRLLTRRAGARLATLIIDEGFGTQDGKGREKLVDVLSAVRDEFEKVIVITHIDELKDAFPARLEVVKTPSGSQVTLLEGVGA